MSTLSPNMGLPVSAIGVDSGLNWETNLNASLSILDQHNHSSGQGVQISPNGLDINSDLPFGSNNATLLRSTRYAPQVSALSGSADVGCLYVVGNELYYNDVTGGHNIPITSNGSVNAGAGSIGGLPSGTASATFSSGTFVFQSATSTAANIDGGSYIFRNSGAGSNALTLQAPNLSGGSYAITLPANPSAFSFTAVLGLDSSGNMAPLSVTGSNVSSNISLPGNTVQAGSKNVVVSSVNTTTGFAIVRGTVSATGTILAGEGFTVGHGSTGTYSILFTNEFSDTPVVVASPYYASGTPNPELTPLVYATGFLGGGGTINTVQTSAGTAADEPFSFIAIGQR